MDQFENYRDDVIHSGFAIIDDIYTAAEVAALADVIDNAGQSGDNFRKTNDLFAIRRFLKEVPNVTLLLFNDNLRRVIDHVFGIGYFIVKSVYFDKPEKSNWFVAWHQDLTIAVNAKAELDGYGPWTVKPGQFAVRPPLPVLQNNFTIRIHLDDTNEENGALKVLPASHLKNIHRAEDIDWQQETEAICNVKAGGIMLMRPLLMHASGRSTNNKRRRVIHIEFSNTELPAVVNWAEKEMLPQIQAIT